MRCPFCGSEETRVIDKRGIEDLETNRRRRECPRCGKRFTTYERIESPELTVIKKDGRRELFDRKKVEGGILKACEKRPIAREKIDAIVDEIDGELRAEYATEVPSSAIGEAVMRKLKALDEVAYIRFASVYKHFTDLESFERELAALKVVKEPEQPSDSTDFMQLIVTSPITGMAAPWNRERIVKALMRETGLGGEQANEIASAVEKKVFSSGIRTISVSLIRELVNNELFERGLQKKLAKQEILGLSAFNLGNLIYSKSVENSNIVANNPEAVNLAIAEIVLKQFALKEVFSPEVAEAHLSGAIYVHDLGYPTRVYCSAHSIEYLKKYGLRLLNLSSASSPAKHASTLTGHLNTFLASMQAYYAGALGIAFLNIFYAPLLKGKSFAEMKQEAQYLIFSCSQNAFSRGGQTLFIDFNIHFGVPSYLREVPAIGAGGKYMLRRENGEIEYLDEAPRDEEHRVVQPREGRILTYGDFEREAQEFARALLEVWREGDIDGKPFAFPKANCHIDASTFSDPKQFELLKFACEISSENGAPYFIFDREEATLAQCCRLKTKIEDKYMLQHPESMRFCGFQNVTINLPQAAYRAGERARSSGGLPDVGDVIKEVLWGMDLAMKAHLEKRRFIQKIMSQPGTPLWQLGRTAFDGMPYLDLDKATYIIGMLGLNECVKYVTGKHLHESEDALKTGLKIISAMYLHAKELGKKHRLKIVLEETPAESASLRMARIDLARFPEAKEFVRGNKETGEVYYTNSIHLVSDAPVSITERIEKQALFNVLIEAGAITHVFLGEQRPSPESVLALVKKTWENTQSAQIVVSPEFTVCENCRRVGRGYARNKEKQPRCEYCGSINVYGISRVVGYYSRINNWNKSKQAEFRDRQQGNYAIPQKTVVTIAR